MNKSINLERERERERERVRKAAKDVDKGGHTLASSLFFRWNQISSKFNQDFLVFFDGGYRLVLES